MQIVFLRSRSSIPCESIDLVTRLDLWSRSIFVRSGSDAILVRTFPPKFREICRIYLELAGEKHFDYRHTQTQTTRTESTSSFLFLRNHPKQWEKKTTIKHFYPLLQLTFAPKHMYEYFIIVIKHLQNKTKKIRKKTKEEEHWVYS